MVQPASGFAIVGVAARVQKTGGKDRDGAHRRHRIIEPQLPRDRVRKSSRRENGIGHGDPECRRAGSPGRRRQRRPVRIGRLPQASGGRVRRASDHWRRSRGRLEGFRRVRTRWPLRRIGCMRCCSDPAVLAQAIPGCESLEKIGDDEYRMKMKMRRSSPPSQGAFSKVRCGSPKKILHRASRMEVDRSRQNRLCERRRRADAGSGRRGDGESNV